MKTQVKSPKLLVNSFVQDPIEIKTNKLISIFVRDRHLMSVFNKRYCYDRVVLREWNLQENANNRYYIESSNQQQQGSEVLEKSIPYRLQRCPHISATLWVPKQPPKSNQLELRKRKWYIKNIYRHKLGKVVNVEISNDTNCRAVAWRYNWWGKKLPVAYRWEM